MSNPAAEARSEMRTTVTVPPRGMNYKTVKFAIFADAMVKLGITNPGDLSEHLGYSRGAHSVWRKSGRLPKSAALACECLLRRQNKEEDKVPTTLYILRVPEQHVLALRSFCAALGINARIIDTGENPQAQ